jgi:hypothetical protein
VLEGASARHNARSHELMSCAALNCLPDSSQTCICSHAGHAVSQRPAMQMPCSSSPTTCSRALIQQAQSKSTANLSSVAMIFPGLSTMSCSVNRTMFFFHPAMPVPYPRPDETAANQIKHMARLQSTLCASRRHTPAWWNCCLAVAAHGALERECERAREQQSNRAISFSLSLLLS